MSNFDGSGRGGAVGSKIDEQDGVAALMILRMLADMAKEEAGARVARTKISCESIDDLAFSDDEELRIISVKNTPLTQLALIRESARLGCREANAAEKGKVLRIVCLVGSVNPAAVALSDALDELRAVLKGPVRPEETIRDWSARHAVTVKPGRKATANSPAILVELEHVERPETFMIEVFYHRMDSEQYRAEAVRLIRKIAPLTDFTDERADQLLNKCLSDLGEARRNRGTIALAYFVDLLAAATVPPLVQAQLTRYRLTRYGYSIDLELSRLLEDDQKLLKAAHSTARLRFHQALKRELPISLLKGPVRCIECGHGLMANRYGFGEGGIACPSCGFAPYLSVLYACDCGNPVLLVAQPTPTLTDSMIEISKGADTVCSCGRAVDRTRMNTRVFVMQLPWPPEKFDFQKLIDDRVEAGIPIKISDAKWYEPKATWSLGKGTLQQLPFD